MAARAPSPQISGKSTLHYSLLDVCELLIREVVSVFSARVIFQPVPRAFAVEPFKENSSTVNPVRIAGTPRIILF